MYKYSYWQISHVFTLIKVSYVILRILSTTFSLFGPVWLLVVLYQREILSISASRMLDHNYQLLFLGELTSFPTPVLSHWAVAIRNEVPHPKKSFSKESYSLYYTAVTTEPSLFQSENNCYLIFPICV